jgi:hypothetical protein
MTSLKPKRKAEFNARLLPDGYVLIHSQDSSWVYTLSPLGGLVWEFCDGVNTAQEIAALVGSQTELDTKPEDVATLLKDLEEKGLLTYPDN